MTFRPYPPGSPVTPASVPPPHREPLERCPGCGYVKAARKPCHTCRLLGVSHE